MHETRLYWGLASFMHFLFSMYNRYTLYIISKRHTLAHMLSQRPSFRIKCEPPCVLERNRSKCMQETTINEESEIMKVEITVKKERIN